MENRPLAYVFKLAQFQTHTPLNSRYERSMQALVHRWRKCIANGGDYVKK
jgi:hypothetical protein